MRRLAWATDIHLEFCDDARIDAFCQAVAAASPDALLLGGDIGQAPSVVEFLKRLEQAIACPIDFVLGNHDFYTGSIEDVRAQVSQLTDQVQRLRWLPKTGVVMLSEDTALIGVDGWADGRYGDFFGSLVQLNDYQLIRELSWLDPTERFARLNRLGDEQAARLDVLLREALASRQFVVVLTHVPPFAEAAWHEGKQSGPDWLPHFSSKAAGDVLLAAAAAHPDRELLVLCGHTHGAGTVQMRPNLQVRTGGAAYGSPAVQQIVDVP